MSYPTEKARTLFEELMDVFDWKYIAEIFIEGDKIGAFPNKAIKGIKKIHTDGCLYTITKQRIAFTGAAQKQ